MGQQQDRHVAAPELLLVDGEGLPDNVFIERLWRSLKYADVYLKGYAMPTVARRRPASAHTSPSTTSGALHSGKWIVWTVRHRLTEEKHTMRFTLLRNAVGTPPAGMASSISDMPGAG